MIRQDQVREGLRVKLLEFESEPEQEGTVLSARVKNGTVIVDLDKRFREGEDDCGIREVPLELLEVLRG